MISKKTKALAAGILAAAMSASAILPSAASAAKISEYATEKDANTSYAKMFESLYDDVITNGQKNGYLSKNTNGAGSFGIPYHAVETMVVEAPDYGHETTSEAMSYIVWVTAMHDVLAKKGAINGSAGDLEKGWKTLEAVIPGWSKEAYQGDVKGEPVDYSSIWKQDKGLKADAMTEQPDPKEYPEGQKPGGDAYNPIYKDFVSAYGSDNGYYLMHWLADVDDWYGFGGATPGKANGKLTFINTFQRGEQESCFETVPQPCLEELKYGDTTMKDDNNGNGIKAIFNGDGKVPKQYSFTNAPDAEDRAIQAIYFANVNGVDCGSMSGDAGKMGDQCRNDMFDKYYKKIGCQSLSSPSCTTKEDSQHFLMAWYTSWGGALDASYGNYSWAWQIGCSHSHQFYQNPLAAYALAYDKNISGGMKATGAKADYEKSLQRQIELYLWLQSADGPFAGGCTNSKDGQYKTYGSSDALFYDMTYVEHPVYADPGSNHWIGNQVWSTQRLAELYYYVKVNGDASKGQTYGGLSLEEALDALLGRWIDWFLDNTMFNYVDDDGNEMAYAIPSTLDWKGQPASWDSSTKYDPKANSGLTCTIGGYGQGDIGCVSSLCNTLIYYAAANGVKASEADPATTTVTEIKGDSKDNTDRGAKALLLANKLMSAQWNTARDEIGIAYEDHNDSLIRVFEQEVYIPSYYSGTMPDGSKLDGKGKNTFSSIRKIYEDDEMYKACKKIYEDTGSTHTYTYKLHRFWHMGDALMTTGTMALLYPEVKPLANYTGEDGEDQPTTGGSQGKYLAGDANEDEQVTVADAAAILQYLGNNEEFPLSTQGIENGDVDGKKGLTPSDAVVIQKYCANLISKLPQ